jgi:hypothetical protein
MLDKSELHFFNDIGYYHVPFTHCPTGGDLRMSLKCHCKPEDNFDWKGYSCKFLFLTLLCFGVEYADVEDRFDEVFRFESDAETGWVREGERLAGLYESAFFVSDLRSGWCLGSGPPVLGAGFLSECYFSPK